MLSNDISLYSDLPLTAVISKQYQQLASDCAYRKYNENQRVGWPAGAPQQDYSETGQRTDRILMLRGCIMLMCRVYAV